MLAARFRVGQFNRFAFLKRTGDCSNLSGQFLRDFRSCPLRLKEIRICEDRPQQVQDVWTVDVRICELVCLLHRTVEVGANDVTIEIADNEQRGIEQRLAIAQELLIRGIEILLFALVFPCKESVLPNVGEAALAISVWFLGDSAGIVERKKPGVFDDALLKTKRFAAGRISSCRRWLT